MGGATAAQAAIEIDSCGTLNVSNAYYILNTSVNASAPPACFQITANNITFDGAGNTVTYGRSGSYGVMIYTNINNITIKNLSIAQNESTTNSVPGIYAYLMTGSTITNNTIMTVNSASYGIHFMYSYSNIISNNIISTTGSNS